MKNMPGILIIALGIAMGCGGEKKSAQTPTKSGVVATNYPLKYLAARLSPQPDQVLYLVDPDIDPAFWKPDDKAIEKMQNAQLILLNGADYSKWKNTVSLDDSTVVSTATGFKDKWIEIKDAVTHQHGPGGEHSHGAIAFTTWLDPALAILQAEAVAGALKKVYPDDASSIDEKLAKLRKDLEGLATKLDEAHASYQKQPLYASHPVYQYLARRHGWKLESLHWEPEQMPSEEQWKEFDKLHKEHAAKFMIWEGEPADEIVKELEKRGVRCVVYEPCGNTPEDGDLLSVMLKNVDNLQVALQPN